MPTILDHPRAAASRPREGSGPLAPHPIARSDGDTSPADVCHVRRLGLVEYEDGVEAQSHLAAARAEDRIPDQLLILEHPHVVTIGRRTRYAGGLSAHLRASLETLAHLDVDLYETDRGGAVTYHGPGQLVVYPILKLTGRRRDVHRYVRDLEEVIIRTLHDFGIAATRRPGLTGVWVGQQKIASLGVHLSRWVTTHGLALNVNTDLRFFDLIVPCGLPGVRMTSMEEQLGRPLSLSDVADRVIAHFGEIFERRMEERPLTRESVQVLIRTPDRYLLLKRTAERGGFWQPVTGLIEPGESPAQAAVREVWEETGITVVAATEGIIEKTPHFARSLAFRPSLLRLPYTHAFLWTSPPSPQLSVPLFLREHSFLLILPEPSAVRLNPAEHEAFCFADVPTALSLVPWKGNRRAIALSERLRAVLASPEGLQAI